MYAAVTRLNPVTGQSPAGEGGWYPEEKLSVEQALLGFTKNGAYGWFKEGRMGAIERGKWADWVIVDRDVTLREGGGSKDLVVKETWVGGRKVFPVDDALVEESWIAKAYSQALKMVDLATGRTKGTAREEL
jgi:predicted amidohydrolase YtcJ